MKHLLPEKPILVYPSLAATLGLEEATMVSLLDELTHYQTATNSINPINHAHQWYQLPATQLREHMPFWDDADIQRISQRLRDLGLILLRSAPFTQSQQLDFAFNRSLHEKPTVSPSTPMRTINPGATTIAANWQPDRETFIALGQLSIPEHFAREQVPEFVRYWRESGEAQRSWGSKFISHTKRQWAFHSSRMARQNRAATLPNNWQPSNELLEQIASEGIPTTFVNQVLQQFCRYHQRSGTTHLNWDMPFFSWVKEEWQKRDTPFIESKQATGMKPQWQPDQHTRHYLQTSYGIDPVFIEECIPEFIHKWTEKQAIYSEWGKVFAEHVIEQWRFVQLGINKNPERKPITKDWQPSGDCMEILQIQSGINRQFIQHQIAEFILYWSNRGDPMHSWDNIFLRHVKKEWAATHQGNQHERQQNTSGSARTKDRSIAEQLSDRSWAS